MRAGRRRLHGGRVCGAVDGVGGCRRGLLGGEDGNEFGVLLEEEVGEGGPEEGSVDPIEPGRGRGVGVEAVGAEELDPVDSGQVGPPARQDLRLVAVHPRAGSKVRRLVLCDHLLQALPCDDVALVDEAVQQLCRRLDDRHVWNL